MTLDVDRVLSHSRPPMWIRLQDHPATVLKHMAIINRNEADFSIVHVLLYTMADLEGVSRLLPPLGHQTEVTCTSEWLSHSSRVHQIRRPRRGSLQC